MGRFLFPSSPKSTKVVTRCPNIKEDSVFVKCANADIKFRLFKAAQRRFHKNLNAIPMNVYERYRSFCIRSMEKGPQFTVEQELAVQWEIAFLNNLATVPKLSDEEDDMYYDDRDRDVKLECK